MRHQTFTQLRSAVNGATRPMVSMPPLRKALLGAIALGILFVAWSRWPSISEGLDSDMATVLITKRYVPAFGPLKADDLIIRQIPKNLAPAGVLHTTEELADSKGRTIFTTAVALPEGQMVTRALLQEVSKSHGLSTLLDPGKVAVSVSVDATHGAGGWVQPGDSVALFVTTLSPKGRSTRLLFPEVKILAVDRVRLGASPTKKSAEELAGLVGTSESNTLTLLLNPMQAHTLIEARDQGNITVVLRGLGDDMPWTL